MAKGSGRTGRRTKIRHLFRVRRQKGVHRNGVRTRGAAESAVAGGVGDRVLDSVASRSSSVRVSQPYGFRPSDIVRANIRFTTDISRVLAKNSGDSDVVISADNVFDMMMMALAGASGDTLDAMWRVMGLSQMASPTRDNVRSALDATGSLMREQAVATDGFTLHSASRIYSGPAAEFRDEYMATVKDVFGADAERVGVGDEGRINRRVSEQTKGYIDSIVSDGTIDTLTAAILVGARYLDAEWFRRFDKDDTRSGAFRLAGRGKVEIPMMSQTEYFQYAEVDGLKLLEMPYKIPRDRLVEIRDAAHDTDSYLREVSKAAPGAMVVVLPGGEPTTFGRFVEEHSSWMDRAVQFAREGGDTKSVHVQIPRFRSDGNFSDLSPVLSSLGMDVAFGQEANFAWMFSRTPGLAYIDKVAHRARVDVDELGTRAAAAAAAVTRCLGISIPDVSFKADKPFFWMIRSGVDALPIFSGWVARPEAPPAQRTSEGKSGEDIFTLSDGPF